MLPFTDNNLSARYATSSNAQLMELFGVTENILKKRAKKLGLRKAPEYLSATRSAVQKGRPGLRGPDAPNWKGGRPWERFKNPEYVRWRTAVLERDKYTCQDCHRQCKKRERGLAAHHVKPYADYPEFRYDVDNGLTLCRMCHMTRHRRAPLPKDLISCACGCGTLISPFDPYGRPRKYVNHHAGKGRKMSLD